MPKQIYVIRVEGLLGEVWMSWFEGLKIRHLESGESLLVGSLDQAMLRGVLTKISDLGLNLISVQRADWNDCDQDKEACL